MPPLLRRPVFLGPLLVVATIGLAQILGAIGLGILIRLGATGLIGDIQTPLSASFFVRPFPVRGERARTVRVRQPGIAPWHTAPGGAT